MAVIKTLACVLHQISFLGIRPVDRKIVLSLIPDECPRGNCIEYFGYIRVLVSLTWLDASNATS